MSKVAIIQSNFLPWKGYFDFISYVDHFVFYDTCQYTKRDWRNRNKIKVVNGDSWISVPVQVKSKFDQKINETKVSDPNWYNVIWNKIDYNYKKAPFYKEIKENLFDNIMSKIESDLISDINQTLIKFISKEYLGITTEFYQSENFEMSEDRNQRLIDISLSLGANEYVSGEAAKCYLDNQLFIDNDLKLSFMSYTGYPNYDQFHGEFDHFVSIIDLLMMKGPSAKDFMLHVKSLA